MGTRLLAHQVLPGLQPPFHGYAAVASSCPMLAGPGVCQGASFLYQFHAVMIRPKRPLLWRRIMSHNASHLSSACASMCTHNLKDFILCVLVFGLHWSTYMRHMCAWCPWKSECGVRAPSYRRLEMAVCMPGTVVTEGYNWPCAYWERNPSPLQYQQVLLTTNHLSSPPEVILNIVYTLLNDIIFIGKKSQSD